jgi:transcriptional regulator GlxA family with amidase domain
MACCCRAAACARSLQHAGASMTIDPSTANETERASADRDKALRSLVERAENLALADVNQPLHISALCLALGVSERTLRKAFRRVHGLPPCRQLRMLRLSQARRALLSADGRQTTVTEIATEHGFVELGRFSVEYRTIFGESPSQTLSRAEQRRIFAPARGTADHQDHPGFGA